MNTKLPRVADILSSSRKIASGVPDPGPDTGHPASPEGNLPVPSGDTAAAAVSEPKDAYGELAAVGEGAKPEDKMSTTINTKVGPDGEALRSELTVTQNIPDPGPESDHPASPKNASLFDDCKNVESVTSKLAAIVNSLTEKLDLIEKLAGQPAGDNSPPAKKISPEAMHDIGPDVEDDVMTPAKMAALLHEIVPDTLDEQGQSIRAKTAAALSARLSPAIADGIERANNLASFIKLASVDPAAAEAMMSADPAAMGGMPPGGDMGGMPPAPAGDMGGMPPGGDMGGMPPAPGGDMGGMSPGGTSGDQGSDEQALLAAIEQVASENGVDPKQLLQHLLSSLGGDAGGDAGAGAGDSGAPAPDIGGSTPPEASAASDSGPSTGKDESEPAPDSDDEGKKSAAFQRKLLLVTARKLAGELGKTPAEIARNC